MIVRILDNSQVEGKGFSLITGRVRAKLNYEVTGYGLLKYRIFYKHILYLLFIYFAIRVLFAQLFQMSVNKLVAWKISCGVDSTFSPYVFAGWLMFIQSYSYTLTLRFCFILLLPYMYI